MTPVGDTPQVADITTLEDTQSGAIVINRNAGDGSEVTHFKVSGITNGALYKNDGTTAISDGSYITFAEAQAGLKFTPDADSTSAGSFDVQSSEDGTSVAAQSSATATSTITVTPVGDTRRWRTSRRSRTPSRVGSSSTAMRGMAARSPTSRSAASATARSTSRMAPPP